MVEDGALNLKGYLNCFIDSKVTAILVNKDNLDKNTAFYETYCFGVQVSIQN